MISRRRRSTSSSGGGRRRRPLLVASAVLDVAACSSKAERYVIPRVAPEGSAPRAISEAPRTGGTRGSPCTRPPRGAYLAAAYLPTCSSSMLDAAATPSAHPL